MNIKAIHRIIFPIVYTLFIVETTYLVVTQFSTKAVEVEKNTGLVDQEDKSGVAKDPTAVPSLPEVSQSTAGKAPQVEPVQKKETEGASVSDPAVKIGGMTRAEINAIVDRIDVLIGDDEEIKAVQAARTIMDSPDPEVRRAALDAFEWVGIKALGELSQMLSDSDPEIASDAYVGWEAAVEDIDDQQLRAQMLAAGIKNLQNQEDAEGAVLMLDRSDDDVAVRALVDIIQNGSPVAARVAEEHFEFITSEKYRSPEAAERWIAEEVVK